MTPKHDSFQQLRSALVQEWNPQTMTERLLVSDMATARFVMDSLKQAQLDEIETETPERLAEAVRVEELYARRYYRALRELIRLREGRPAPPAPVRSERPRLQIVARNPKAA